ncbi:uncharacterized protein CC84DRAFT_1171767 [Paraphaeosphaeria sporulosa]|uniref:Uncharacterized protein n=1 Tax=Paraphaeosphaeria sporulosa TaxID=1460663 RepID=A0A177D132_9PLEO|nr:uncharacterized protein CC84DRAFT_1171767 [Paraphaeosphaeria sporulosa]OAG13171.1 hypothetical protein CC84DRAFT_1171767 [Paraphaeosphaeria sporulosa]
MAAAVVLRQKDRELHLHRGSGDYVQMIFAASSAVVRIGRPMAAARQRSQTGRPVREACDEKAAAGRTLAEEPVAEAIGRERAAGGRAGGRVAAAAAGGRPGQREGRSASVWAGGGCASAATTARGQGELPSAELACLANGGRRARSPVRIELAPECRAWASPWLGGETPVPSVVDVHGKCPLLPAGDLLRPPGTSPRAGRHDDGGPTAHASMLAVIDRADEPHWRRGRPSVWLPSRIAPANHAALVCIYLHTFTYTCTAVRRLPLLHPVYQDPASRSHALHTLAAAPRTARRHTPRGAVQRYTSQIAPSTPPDAQQKPADNTPSSAVTPLDERRPPAPPSAPRSICPALCHLGPPAFKETNVCHQPAPHDRKFAPLCAAPSRANACSDLSSRPPPALRVAARVAIATSSTARRVPTTPRVQTPVVHRRSPLPVRHTSATSELVVGLGIYRPETTATSFDAPDHRPILPRIHTSAPPTTPQGVARKSPSPCASIAI